MLYVTVTLEFVVEENRTSGKQRKTSTGNRLMGADAWWCDFPVDDTKVIYSGYQ